MLLITIWSAMASIPFANLLGPGLLQPELARFSAESPGLTSALRIVAFIAALQFGLAIVVALACWLVLELAGILVEGRKPSTATKSAPTCANQLSFRDDFDLPANARR
jgi:hypothetical protein